MDIVATARALHERTSTSTLRTAWELLQIAEPGDIAEIVEPLSDGECFGAAVAIGLLRPELHTAAARAFLARRTRGERRSFEASDFIDVATSRRWIDAGGQALSVDELLVVFERSRFLLEPAIEQRLAGGRLDDARALEQAITGYECRAKAAARAAIARYVFEHEGAEAAARPLQAAIDAAMRKPTIQDGGDELEALEGALRVFVTFVPPEHPGVTRAVDELRSFDGEWFKGIDWCRSRITQTLADAVTPAAPGWLEHAVRAARLGLDARAAAHLDAARARLGLAEGSGESPPPPVSTFTHESLDVIGKNDRFRFRCWQALWRGSDALAKGDRDDALASFTVAFTPPLTPLTSEERAAWVGALLDTAAPGDPKAASDEARQRLAPLAGREPPGPDMRARIALVLARGEGSSLPAVLSMLPPSEASAVKALASPRRRAVKRRHKAPAADVVARVTEGSDLDDSDALSLWQHRVARAHLGLGQIDEAIDTLERMDDCALAGSGPGPLASEIARHLDTHPRGWTWLRAEKLLAVLGSGAVFPQDLADALLDVLPGAWSVLTPPPSLAPLLAVLARSPLDQTMVDLARALAHWRHGQRSEAKAAIDQAFARIDAVVKGGFWYIGPRTFLRVLGEMPELPGWATYWERAFALYATRVDPHAASEGIRWRALHPAARERRLMVAQVLRAWPEPIGDAVFDAACAALAAGPLDDELVATLFRAVQQAGQARRAIIATASAAQRSGQHEQAGALAALAGLEG